jgi:hypothetical protein
LETIFLVASYPCGTDPCIASIFGPTMSTYYWSASTHATFPGSAWLVYFSSPNPVAYSQKAFSFGAVRAVR